MFLMCSSISFSNGKDIFTIIILSHQAQCHQVKEKRKEINT
jgi:hypothetical protein